MPMPSWWGQLNKRVFNPRAVRGGKWPVIHHVGRTSGRRYRTPLEATAVADGFVFTLVYGSRSDWVRNVVAAGTATLEVDGQTVDLVEPALLGADEAFALLPAGRRRPPRLLRIDEFLWMRRAPGAAGDAPRDGGAG
jgi:deazaflavin-dependent oxidoreductase (nitroreductase family)